MAKRMISTDLFKDPFIKALQGPYKVLYVYILTDCDHAGIWPEELDIASMRCGFDYDIEDVKKVFKDKIIFFKNEWFIPGFIKFQYGQLNKNNRVHLSVINRLEEKNIKGLLSPLKAPSEGVKDIYKDKDKDKDKDIERKGIEKKQNIPTEKDFIEYASRNKPNVDLQEVRLKYRAWVENDWKDGKGNSIKKWTSKLLQTLPYIKESKLSHRTDEEITAEKIALAESQSDL